MQISIHTSAREVTSFGSVFGQYCGNFNPHFRKGSDRISTDCSPLYSIFQSTLPQGKWRKKLHHYEIGLVFQSTLPQGKWPDDFGFKCKGGEFQSTLPQGKWRCIRLERFILGYFNPHFRKGSDWYHTDIPGIAGISIHTSAREVTRLMYCVPDQYWISIHTSAREVTEPFL